jgi:hypothetical protein
MWKEKVDEAINVTITLVRLIETEYIIFKFLDCRIVDLHLLYD